MYELAEKYLRKEALPLIFCPGCGDGTLLNCTIRAIDRLGIWSNMACVSGIGCSSWLPVYLDLDVIHSLHGRAIPNATGLKLARPDKHVLVFTGDGDCVGIGGNHIIHAARRNLDITVVMMNNSIYGMTGGQKAPTTPYDAITKTSPLGNDEEPFELSKLIIGAGATYYARWCTAYPVQLENALVKAIEHKGFSFVEVLSPCPTQAGRNIFRTKTPAELLQLYRDNTYILKKGEAPDPNAGKIALGLLYESNDRPEFTETLQARRERANENHD